MGQHVAQDKLSPDISQKLGETDLRGYSTALMFFGVRINEQKFMTHNFKINNSGSSGRPEISLMGQHVAQIKLIP